MFFPRCCIVLYFINYFSLSSQLLLPHSRLLASYESELPNLLVVAFVWTERRNYYLITCDDIDERKKKGKKCDDGTNKKYQINNDRNGHKQSHTHSNTHIYELILLYCCWFDYIGLVVASSAVSFYLIFLYIFLLFLWEKWMIWGDDSRKKKAQIIFHTLDTGKLLDTNIELSFCVSPPAMIAFVGWFVLCSTWICLSSHLNIIWWYLCKWIWWDIFSDSKQEMIPHNNKWCFCLFALFLYWGH